MPRPRKSLAELEANGSLAHNAGRLKDRTPPPEPKAPIKKSPRHLTEEQQKVWREIVSGAPDGLLGSCDMISVEVAVRLTIKMRAGLMDKTSEHISLANLMEKLGLSPAGRQRFNSVPTVTKEDKDEADPWDL